MPYIAQPPKSQDPDTILGQRVPASMASAGWGPKPAIDVPVYIASKIRDFIKGSGDDPTTAFSGPTGMPAAILSEGDKMAAHSALKGIADRYRNISPMSASELMKVSGSKSELATNEFRNKLNEIVKESGGDPHRLASWIEHWNDSSLSQGAMPWRGAAALSADPTAELLGSSLVSSPERRRAFRDIQSSVIRNKGPRPEVGPLSMDLRKKNIQKEVSNVLSEATDPEAIRTAGIVSELSGHIQNKEAPGQFLHRGIADIGDSTEASRVIQGRTPRIGYLSSWSESPERAAGFSQPIGLSQPGTQSRQGAMLRVPQIPETIQYSHRLYDPYHFAYGPDAGEAEVVLKDPQVLKRYMDFTRSFREPRTMDPTFGLRNDALKNAPWTPIGTPFGAK